MNANPEFASFARLIESLRPWLDQVVVVGGWAHRLYRLHPLAQQLRYEPLATLDVDIALPVRFKVSGDEIYKRLSSNGFEAEFLGHHNPPAAHYRLREPGLEFYAEFVAPLAGSALTRRGRSKATQNVGGICSQNLRFVELLLANPWSIPLSATHGFPLQDETRVQIANPVSFLAQKILIHSRRSRQDRAKDILYMTCTTQSRLSRRELTSCALNGRTSGPSSTRAAFALCSTRRHRYLGQLPIRFGPHRESSRAGIRLPMRYGKPASWGSRGSSNQRTYKSRASIMTFAASFYPEPSGCVTKPRQIRRPAHAMELSLFDVLAFC